MITILVEFGVAPENVSKAQRLVQELAEGSIKEEGCIYYDAKQDSSDETSFILFEVFENKEAQDFHKTTKHYEEVLKEQLSPLMLEKKVRFLI